MDDLEYLNRIAAANRPLPKSGGGLAGILKSKIFRVAVIGLTLLVVVLIFAAMIGKTGGKEKSLLIQLNTRMNNMQLTLTTNGTNIKSSKLRGMNASLATTLAETTRGLYSVLVSDYGFGQEGETTDMKIMQEEEEHKAELETVLKNAKLNGIFDRIYVSRMTYEITMLLSLESEIIGRTKNEVVQSTLIKSSESLRLLREQFDTYSDATN